MLSMPKARPVPDYLKNLLCFILLLLAVWKVSSGLEQQMDIRFYDESYYLTQGLFHSPDKWITDYSPLYSLWYKAAGLFTPEPVALYYFAYRFWTLFLGFSIFVLLRFAGISRLTAICWSLASIASQLALPLWPKAGHLALAGTVIGIFGLYRWRGSLLSQLLWVAGLGLLFSYCRPEFLAAAVSAALLIPFAWFQSGKQLWKPVAIIPFLAAFTCIFLWGIPIGQSGRGLVAFGQHFVHNWRNISEPGSSQLMEDWVNWRPLFIRHFGMAGNPWQAFLANPHHMLLHLWFNFRYLLFNSLVYFSETMFPFRITGISSLYGFISFLAFCEWKGNFQTSENFFRKIKGQSWAGLLPWIILALPSLLAGFLFQPRPHYILPLLPFFVFGLALYSRGLSFSVGFRGARLVQAMLPIALLFLLPDTSAFFSIGKKKSPLSNGTAPENNAHFGVVTSASQVHKTLVTELSKYPFPDNFRIFDASTGASEYLGRRLVQCGKTGFEMNYSALRNFPRFLDSAGVQGILLHKTMLYDHFFTQNPFCQKLRSQPESLGWKKIPVGAAGDSLLIRFPRNQQGGSRAGN